MYKGIICFKFNKRLDIDKLRLIFFIININEILY